MAENNKVQEKFGWFRNKSILPIVTTRPRDPPIPVTAEVTCAEEIILASFLLL